jgi:hypothetical protein
MKLFRELYEAVPPSDRHIITAAVVVSIVLLAVAAVAQLVAP